MDISVVYHDTNHGILGYEELRKCKWSCFSNEISIKEDLSNVRDSLKSLAKDKRSNVFVLFGSSEMKEAVLKEAIERDMRNKIWILADTADRSFGYPNFRHNRSKRIKNIGSYLFLVFPTAGRDKNFKKYFLNLNYSAVQHNLWIKNFLELKHRNGSNSTTLRKWKYKFKFSVVSFVRNAIKVYEKHWLRQLRLMSPLSFKCQSYSKESSLKKISFKGLNKELIEFDEEGVIKNYFYKVSMIPPKTMENKKSKRILLKWSSRSSSFINVNKKALQHFAYVYSNCSPDCLPGFTGKMYDPKRSCCWTCVSCPKHHIKPTHGKFKCQKCPFNTRPNKYRTKCMNVMHLEITHNDVEGKIILLVSFICMVVNIFILVIFVAKRQTPVVRSSSFKSSLFQLFCHLLLFVTSCLMVIDIPIIRCKVLATMFFLITLVISVTVAKVSRLVFIFRCRRILEAEEVSKFKSLEMSFITICAGVNILISSVICAVHKTEVKDVVQITEKSYTIYHDCRNTLAIYTANITYVLILEIVCGIQCFRGRKIPEEFNEAKYISYATFLSTVAICLSILLKFGAVFSKTSTLLQILFLLFSNLSVLLLLYGYKMFIIISRPEKNTTKIFKNTLWYDEEHMDNQPKEVHAESPPIAVVNPT